MNFKLSIKILLFTGAFLFFLLPVHFVKADVCCCDTAGNVINDPESCEKASERWNTETILLHDGSCKPSEDTKACQQKKGEIVEASSADQSAKGSGGMICDANSCEHGGLFKEASGDCLCCGNCSLDDFLLIGKAVYNLILGVVGSLMLLMFIIGGFYLLTSAGSSEKIEKGKKYLVNAVIGGIIVFGAFSLVNFLIERAVKEEGAKNYQVEEE
ncbi:MAG: pilin [Patescibacteria group bacterium]|nr:pilin [Patescibacteria group bacterium]MDD5490834.1 pilin [Patescibacteria group bacterium]